jgi:hypothetical protein
LHPESLTTSQDIVEKRISDTAEDTEIQLIEDIKKSKVFALELDEPTDIQNNSILLTYVRYIGHYESNLMENMLSTSDLHVHTTSSVIFKVYISFDGNCAYSL